MRNPNFHTALPGFFFFFFILSSCRPSLQEYSSPALPLNPRLAQAFIALQAWKHAIFSDPKNLTANWYGPNVCKYTRVYCTAALDDPHVEVVAGIDLNHGDIQGFLPEELGLLTDLALFHINSNRFHGSIPKSFCELRLLYELDLSNNIFEGEFPEVVLRLPSLKYLDIRYNNFEGYVPSRVFDLKLDALFLNNNGFRFSLPENIGNSPVSVLVLANNQINGCLPRSVAKMGATLNELMLTNTGLAGCLPPEVGALGRLTVLDVSWNELVGPLPETIGKMRRLEQLNVAGNGLSGDIPESICALPNLKNFTYSFNFFYGEPARCLKLQDKDDRKNCIPGRPLQRSKEQCASFLSHPAHSFVLKNLLQTNHIPNECSHGISKKLEGSSCPDMNR
ncbi:hypothetical protein H6P81_004838 [Aristolochia fimbriata]|uniref:Cell wall hydroxyproline-rich glycoprotein n=1 Tax=Aristolochia fimbriata TaxID=158543 RepID=A0AAV7ETG3_ARIFI|nr:hypothetical protein H6P81_004838 [Aristolochia fimbriata]